MGIGRTVFDDCLLGETNGYTEVYILRVKMNKKGHEKLIRRSVQ